jgi:hypothetical protein
MSTTFNFDELDGIEVDEKDFIPIDIFADDYPFSLSFDPITIELADFIREMS